MKNSGHDGSARMIIGNMAEGYQPDGSFGIEKGGYLDWTVKTGNGSLYSTVEDLYKWDRALYTDKILSKKFTDKMFTNLYRSYWYGWFIDTQFNRQRIYFTGRSPGFTAYIGRYPAENICIIVLGNNYVPLLQILELTWPLFCSEKKPDAPVLSKQENWSIGSTWINWPIPVWQQIFYSEYAMTIREKEGRLFSDWGELIPTASSGFIDRSIGRRCIS